MFIPRGELIFCIWTCPGGPEVNTQWQVASIFFFLIIVPSGQVSKLATCNLMHRLPENKRLQKPTVSHVHILDSEREDSAVAPPLSVFPSWYLRGKNATHPRCLQVVKTRTSVRRTRWQPSPKPPNYPTPPPPSPTPPPPTWSNKRGVCERKPSSVILKKSSLPQWFLQTGEASGTASTWKGFRLNQRRKNVYWN